MNHFVAENSLSGFIDASVLFRGRGFLWPTLSFLSFLLQIFGISLQTYKLLKLKNSRGISVKSVVVISFAQFLAVFNVIFIYRVQIFYAIQQSIKTIVAEFIPYITIFLSWFIFLIIVGFTLIFRNTKNIVSLQDHSELFSITDNEKTQGREMKTSKNGIFQVIILLIILLLMQSIFAAFHMASVSTTNVIGRICSIISVLLYLYSIFPQLFSSYLLRNKKNAVSTLGLFFLVLSNAINGASILHGYKSDWSTFIIPFIASIQQLLFLLSVVKIKKSKKEPYVKNVVLLIEKSDDSQFTDSLANTPQQAI